ncbi:cell division protein PerM [Rhodococcus opacus]|uniref:cell division protein PerM n=1 Tax=Rhodococcus opacus TaxID=37919 RepID=UPI003B008766
MVDRAQRVAQGARRRAVRDDERRAVRDDERRAVRDDERRAPRQRPVPDADEMRALLAVAFRPAGVTVVLLSALIVVTLVAANSDLTGTFGAIAASWLAIHQVPLTIDGTSLGVLPLIPTAGMVWVVARGCAAVVHPASSRRHALQVIGAAVAGPLVVTAIALAVIADASAVIPLSSPNALAAFGWVLSVHLLAAGIGVTVAMWPTVGAEFPSWVRDAVRPGLRAMMAILGAGAVMVTISLLMEWSTVGSLLEDGDGFVGSLGLTILSVLYLPNVVVGASAAVLGGTAQIGDVSVSVFGNVGGSLPPLPLLGAVPDGVSGGAWPALLVIPLLIGVMLGRDCGRRVAGQEALFTVLTAAAGVGVVTAVLGLVSGGRLGAFGTVDLNWWAFGLLTFAWLGLAGAVTAVVVAWHRSRGADDEADAEDEEPHLPGAEEVPAIAAPITEERVVPGEAAPGRVLEAELVDDTEVPAAPVAPQDTEADAEVVVDAEVEEDASAAESDGSGNSGEAPEADLPRGPATPSD